MSQPAMIDPVVSLHNVTKTYSRGGTEVSVLKDLSFVIPAGTFLAIMGPSGLRRYLAILDLR